MVQDKPGNDSGVILIIFIYLTPFLPLSYQGEGEFIG